MFSREFQGGHGNRSTFALLGIHSHFNWKYWQRWLTLSVVAATSGFVLWLVKRMSLGDAVEPHDSASGGAASNVLLNSARAPLRNILDELGRRFFRVARDTAVISRDIRDKLKTQGHAIPDDGAFRSELARNCNIREKLDMIRQEVLAELKVSEDMVARLSEADPESVNLHHEGVRKMLDEALAGLVPSPPGVQVPADFTVERYLQIRQEMQSVKLERVKQLATPGKRFPPEELGRAAAMISQAAEQEVLHKRRAVLGKGGEVFHAATAQYSRDADFRNRLVALDAEHRRALVAAFRIEAPSKA